MKGRTRPNGAGTAYKRGKTWTARVVVAWKERPDGGFTPVYRTKGGFSRKKDALDYIPELFKSPKQEKKLQRALLQAHIPENRYAVIDALKKAGREDLIGSSPECIITARAGDKAHKNKQPASGKTVPARGGKPAAKGANGRRSGTKPAPKQGGKIASKSAKPSSAPRSANKSAPKSQKGKRK